MASKLRNRPSRRLADGGNRGKLARGLRIERENPPAKIVRNNFVDHLGQLLFAFSRDHSLDSHKDFGPRNRRDEHP
jgi:hypothetical protein